MPRGCDQIAHRRGFHILLNQSEYPIDKEREILRKLLKRGVDGIVIEPVSSGDGQTNAELLGELDRGGSPVVLLDNYYPDGELTRIAMDDRADGRLVASHLWEKGHTRIAILYDEGYMPKRLRRDGAIAWLAERGAAPPPEWLIGYEGPAPFGRARAKLDAFLAGAGALPTAFICTSDEEAVELQAVPGGENEYYDKTDLAVMAGDTKDAIRLTNQLKTNHDASAGFLLPLDDVLKKLGYDPEPVFGHSCAR